MASTEQIQTTVNLCMTHADLMPIANVGGFSNEPALSLAKDTLQELLAAPYDWKFNAKDAPVFMTQSMRQDYLFAGACAFTSLYGISIDLASNTAISQVGAVTTVKTLQPHNFSVGDTVFMTGNTVAGYNSTFTQTPTSSGWSGGWVITSIPDSKTFVFTHTSSGLGNSGAPGITDCSWLSSATMTDNADTNANPRVWDVEAVRDLKPGSMPGRPTKVALISQTDTGILKLRLDYLPGSNVYAIAVTYQMKAPTITALTATWAPFPDEYGYVYRQGFLGRCYRYLDHRRADAEMAKAEAIALKASGRDDVENSNQHVTPTRSLMGDYEW